MIVIVGGVSGVLRRNARGKGDEQVHIDGTTSAPQIDSSRNR